MRSTNEQARSTRRGSSAWVALGALTLGTAFLSIPSCEGVLTTFNPCGTVLEFCEPYELQALFGDVPDWTLDPTCSVPFYGVASGDTTSGCSDTIIYTQTPGPRPQGEQP